MPTKLFLKALAVIYGIAFVSFGMQADGLIGAQGILPVGDYLHAVHAALGARAYWAVPTVFWIDASDLALRAAWILGALLAVLLLLGFCRRFCLIGMLVLYLSISSAGQDFWSFQWDILLTEAGFLAIFLDSTPTRVWLFRWLLFRLMFMSGTVKLASGDPTWRDLTALGYHYWTQPLPTPIAWYMCQLPEWFQRVSTGLVLLVELAVPFLIFAGRKWRRIAAGLLSALQVLILLTGNYTFFNWLAIALCILLFAERPVPGGPAPARAHRLVTAGLMAFVLTTSGLQFIEMLSLPVTGLAHSYLAAVAPLRLVNTYGLFAVMTTTRPEIVVQGSNDGQDWRTYEFRYQPGDVKRAPPWVAPYQPRLDWQMWFAALGPVRDSPWFYNFAGRLIEGSAAVRGLLAYDPFPGGAPRYLRAVEYDYQFTDFAERRKTGAWWRRQEKGVWAAFSRR
jgi:lipase maturation factor 1